MPPGPLTGPAAWTGEVMREMPERWTFSLDAAELAEIEAATAAIERSGAPLASVASREAALFQARTGFSPTPRGR